MPSNSRSVQLVQVEPELVEEAPRKQILSIVNGRQFAFNMADYGLTMDSSQSDVIAAIAPAFREQAGVDITAYYKIEKVVDKELIYLFPNSTAGTTAVEELNTMSNDARLKVFEFITEGCKHFWSKGKLQQDRLDAVLNMLVDTADKDPEFLAHLTSYAMLKSDSKDLKVVAVFANFLSDADGTPFSKGSKYHKPNWRAVSQAALQMRDFDAKLVNRVIDLANRKMKFGDGTRFKEGTHVTKTLRTAVRKYLKYREMSHKALEGIRKSGMAHRYCNLYRKVRCVPSDDAASILNWKQRGKQLVKVDMFDFTGLSDLQIAQKIRAKKLAPTGVIGALPKKLSPVIAAAILEQATGDQAVILRSLFSEQGILKDKAVAKVFEEKIATAKTALDRVDRINKEIDESVSKAMKSARATKRKEDMAGVGSIFMDIDVSSSMHSALAIAKEYGAIIAECVPNPTENFKWGTFSDFGQILPLPESFEKDAFAKALYKKHVDGTTDCFANWNYALRNGAEVIITITDGGHNVGNPGIKIKSALKDVSAPKSVVIVKVGSYSSNFAQAIREAGIPVTEITPDALVQSALVTQAIKTAIKGRTAVIEEIMSTPLLKLPEWWESVKVS